MDSGRHTYSGQHSSVGRINPEPKPMILERNWDFEMYPVGSKASNMDPDETLT